MAVTGCTTPNRTASTTTTGPNSGVYAGSGPHSHDIRVDNDRDHAVEVTITVSHDGVEIYRGEHSVAAATERVVAGFGKEAEAPDRPTVTVSVTGSADQSASVEVDVFDCLGNVLLYYREQELQATYSIC